MLWELSVTEQRYRAVLEVGSGVPVTEKVTASPPLILCGAPPGAAGPLRDLTGNPREDPDRALRQVASLPDRRQAYGSSPLVNPCTASAVAPPPPAIPAVSRPFLEQFASNPAYAHIGQRRGDLGTLTFPLGGSDVKPLFGR